MMTPNIDKHIYNPLYIRQGNSIVREASCSNNKFDTLTDLRTHFCCLINCHFYSPAAFLQHKRVLSVSNDYEFSSLMVW